MAENLLTKEEANHLLAMEKIPADGYKPATFPDLGGRIVIPLQSHDGREKFLFNITRKRIALTTSYQTRARQVFVLARLDFGAPHTNPDGTKVGAPHLHVYTEEYGDRVAIEIPPGMLSDVTSGIAILNDFMKYCNIQNCLIKTGLFT